MGVGGMVLLETRKENKMKTRERMFTGAEIRWKRMVGLAMAVTCIGLFLGGCDRVAHAGTPHGAVKKSVERRRVLCSNCKGDGWFSTPCVYCSGTGQVVCPTCNGDGTFAAPGCLSMVCGCNNGKSICWRCTGSGLGRERTKCKQCDGNGSYFVND